MWKFHIISVFFEGECSSIVTSCLRWLCKYVNKSLGRSKIIFYLWMHPCNIVYKLPLYCQNAIKGNNIYICEYCGNPKSILKWMTLKTITEGPQGSSAPLITSSCIEYYWPQTPSGGKFCPTEGRSFAVPSYFPVGLNHPFHEMSSLFGWSS